MQLIHTTAEEKYDLAIQKNYDNFFSLYILFLCIHIKVTKKIINQKN